MNSAQDTYCVNCFRLLHPSAEANQVLAASPEVVTVEPELLEEKTDEQEDSIEQPTQQALLHMESEETSIEEPPNIVTSAEEKTLPQLIPTLGDELGDIDDLLDINTRAMEEPDTSAPGYRRPTSRENQLARLWQQIGIKHAPMDEGRHNLSDGLDKRTTPRQRLLIYILTFALAILPFITKGQVTKALTTDESASALLASEMVIVPTDQPMLIAFDYDASYAGELLPAAKNVLNTLVSRQVPILTMATHVASTDMAALAFSELDTTPIDSQWTDLGYTPSQTGLRLVSTSWQAAFPLAAEPQNTLDATQVSHVLVFSDSLESSLAWIELFGSQVDVPIQMIVTERIYPLLLPYQDSGQLDLLVSGASVISDKDSSIRGDAGLFLFIGVIILAIWGTCAKSHESIGH